MKDIILNASMHIYPEVYLATIFCLLHQSYSQPPHNSSKDLSLLFPIIKSLIISHLPPRALQPPSRGRRTLFPPRAARCDAQLEPTTPASPPHLHDLPGRHTQGGEVAAPVDGNRFAQEGVQPLHLGPAQPAQVPSGGGCGGLRVGAVACQGGSRGHRRGRSRPHGLSCSVRALCFVLRRHDHHAGPRGLDGRNPAGGDGERKQGARWAEANQGWGCGCSDGQGDPGHSSDGDSRQNPEPGPARPERLL